ncbi:hypothetical protein [Methanosalsum natronophilum]|uniref:Uncharacterized protein n=1 Tax=Methanosalsum natronophilum TaxID=768733 RepID=A0A424Z569_9EURY|nr:hypothetical protein [Methanosalsum natronophilum]MCS3923292.1 hypothetical protein [Methanosalsum natronophilum]RQD92582.1 MAG: hypothetical protein D5R95_00275 [Methanosalsum natronophilum]
MGDWLTKNKSKTEDTQELKLFLGSTSDFLSGLKKVVDCTKENISILITGLDENSRAATALSIAQYLDTNFIVDECVFSSDDFEEIKKNAYSKSYVFIEFDCDYEFGEIFNLQALGNKLLIYTLEDVPSNCKEKKWYNLHIRLESESIINGLNEDVVSGFKANAYIIRAPQTHETYDNTSNIFNKDVATIYVTKPLCDTWSAFTNLRMSKRSQE